MHRNKNWITSHFGQLTNNDHHCSTSYSFNWITFFVEYKTLKILCQGVFLNFIWHYDHITQQSHIPISTLLYWYVCMAVKKKKCQRFPGMTPHSKRRAMEWNDEREKNEKKVIDSQWSLFTHIMHIRKQNSSHLLCAYR